MALGQNVTLGRDVALGQAGGHGERSEASCPAVFPAGVAALGQAILYNILQRHVAQHIDSID